MDRLFFSICSQGTPDESTLFIFVPKFNIYIVNFTRDEKILLRLPSDVCFLNRILFKKNILNWVNGMIKADFIPLCFENKGCKLE